MTAALFHRERRARGTAPIALCLAIVVAVALVAVLASAPQAMSEDGPLLVGRLAVADGPVLWYHAAYLPLGWLLVQAPGVDGALLALLLVSALCSVAALGLGAAAARRIGGAAWFPVFVLLASPGWWVNGSRVEVHGTQLFGAALLVWAMCAPALRDVAAERGERRRALVWLVVAGFVALTMHRTNLGLLPTALVWWSGWSGWSAWRRLVAPGACVAFGAALGTALNRSSGLLPSAGGDGGNAWLIENFRNPFDWSFVRAELLEMWPAAVLALVLAVALGGARGRWLAVGGLPLFAFFLWFGVRTSGGYFSGPAVVFAVAGAAAVPTLVRRWGPKLRAVATATFVVAGGYGAWIGVDASWSDTRVELESIAVERVEGYLRLVEPPIEIVLFDPQEQSITGRVHGLHTHNIFGELVEAAPLGVDPATYAQDIVEDARRLVADDGRVALDGGWRAWAAVDPRVAQYMLAVEAALSAEWNTRWVGGEGGLMVVDARASD